MDQLIEIDVAELSERDRDRLEIAVLRVHDELDRVKRLAANKGIIDAWRQSIRSQEWYRVGADAFRDEVDLFLECVDPASWRVESFDKAPVRDMSVPAFRTGYRGEVQINLPVLLEDKRDTRKLKSSWIRTDVAKSSSWSSSFTFGNVYDRNGAKDEQYLTLRGAYKQLKFKTMPLSVLFTLMLTLVGAMEDETDYDDDNCIMMDFREDPNTFNHGDVDKKSWDTPIESMLSDTLCWIPTGKPVEYEMIGQGGQTKGPCWAVVTSVEEFRPLALSPLVDPETVRRERHAAHIAHATKFVAEPPLSYTATDVKLTMAKENQSREPQKVQLSSWGGKGGEEVDVIGFREATLWLNYDRKDNKDRWHVMHKSGIVGGKPFWMFEVFHAGFSSFCFRSALEIDPPSPAQIIMTSIVDPRMATVCLTFTKTNQYVRNMVWPKELQGDDWELFRKLW